MYTIYIYKICKCYPQFQFIVKVQNGYSCVASDHLGRACRFFFSIQYCAGYDLLMYGLDHAEVNSFHI